MSTGWMAVIGPDRVMPRNTQVVWLRHGPALRPSVLPGPSALARRMTLAGAAAPLLT